MHSQPRRYLSPCIYTIVSAARVVVVVVGIVIILAATAVPLPRPRLLFKRRKLMRLRLLSPTHCRRRFVIRVEKSEKRKEPDELFLQTALGSTHVAQTTLARLSGRTLSLTHSVATIQLHSPSHLGLGNLESGIKLELRTFATAILSPERDPGSAASCRCRTRSDLWTSDFLGTMRGSLTNLVKNSFINHD